MIYRFSCLIIIAAVVSCTPSNNQQPEEFEFTASLEKAVVLKSEEDVEDSWIVRPTELTVDDQDRV